MLAGAAVGSAEQCRPLAHEVAPASVFLVEIHAKRRQDAQHLYAHGHEASVSRIGEEQLFYLTSRGLSETEASAMIVNGFIEPLVKELPMEYAVELNRLIQLQMEGSVG